MAPTLIARMYHSSAGLTPDGTVLVAGCDRCYRYKVQPGVEFDPSPTSKVGWTHRSLSFPVVSAKALIGAPGGLQMLSQLGMTRPPKQAW